MSLARLYKKYKGIPKMLPQINLDAQQKEAVFTEEEKVLVIAAAGSGKTRVITERIKHLLESGVEPQSIVAITFTNIAAEEMKARLSGTPHLGDTFIGTIHSFANRVMRQSESYKILTTEVEIELYKELIDKYCNFITFSKYLKYRELKEGWIQGIVTEHEVRSFLTSAERGELHLLNGNISDVEECDGLEITDYPETIDDIRERRNVITFDELLELATNYFRNLDTGINLLVDEFQDIGVIEYNFFNSLSPKSTFLVGDDWQSIYNFKGGCVSIMLNLNKDDDYKKYYLTNNYRCSQSIINLGNDIIKQVSKRIPKEVKCCSGVEGEYLVTSKGELRTIVQNIRDEYSNELNTWFFLVRTNKELHEVKEVMDEERLKSHIFSSEERNNSSDMEKLMKYNSIKLMTVHSAKGLENKNVILYGNFPISTPYYRRNEDERKVMYVGVTRAIESLIIMN